MKPIVAGCLAVLLVACSGGSAPKSRFVVVSPAMDPTIKANTSVRVYAGNYQPHRGDVILFDAPPEERTATISTLLKRVIGLPGETIEARDNQVYINDHLLPEPYLPPGTTTDDLPRQLVPAGEYFVMGDNRAGSSDSRVFGPISQSSITGRVCTCDLHQSS
jgi:signal peptidase I